LNINGQVVRIARDLPNDTITEALLFADCNRSRFCSLQLATKAAASLPQIQGLHTVPAMAPALRYQRTEGLEGPR